MEAAIYFKALQRKQKYRNPDHRITAGSLAEFSSLQIQESSEYLKLLISKQISFTYPGHHCYPQAFYKMLEPPLFIEYLGNPVWLNQQAISVVGARKIQSLTAQWIDTEFILFLQQRQNMIVVSGGAQGVDQAAHMAAVKAGVPTVIVLPTGLEKIFPENLNLKKDFLLKHNACFLSEFEFQTSVRKTFFYYRNRLIAALGDLTFIAQCERKSGTFLTVHHALQNGKTVITLPAHPLMSEFSGNHFLMKEGAFYVSHHRDLLDFWEAEFWSGPVQCNHNN